MAKTKRTQLSRRAMRIASLRTKLAASKKVIKKQKPVKAIATKKVSIVRNSNAFSSLDHLLNATALYQIGEYDRATAAFQKAMAEEDAPEMLESLENAQSELDTADDTSEIDETGDDLDFGDDTEISFDETDDSLDDLSVDGSDNDYLADDFGMEGGDELSGDDSTIDAEDFESEVSSEEEDPESSDDETDSDETENAKVTATKIRKNLAAIASAQKNIGKLVHKN